jgi:hypothetical protein
MIVVDPANPRGIVWLASYPRSGNTWARAFLSTLLNAIENRSQTAIDLNQFALATILDSNAPLFERFLGCPAVQASPEKIAAVRPETHRFLVENTDGIVLLKTHNANAAVHGVPLITFSMSAGAIYLIRNPLDVAISFAKFRGVSVDDVITDMNLSGAAMPTTEETVHEMRGSWSENVTSWTTGAHPSLLVVRYEDMLEKPVETFSEIADHVRMTYTPEQFAAAIEQSSFRRLREQEERVGFGERPDTTERFFREGRAGQWREVLTPAQIDRIISDHGEQMARFGYLPQ